MVGVHVIETAASKEDMAPRRPATVAALDARLSVWGQAARAAVERRSNIVASAAALYAERVGRQAELLQPVPTDPRMALLATDVDVLVLVAASLVPAAVKRSCRLLWVDPDKLQANLTSDLAEPVEGARAEIRRRQALYRRRARLWSDDPARLGALREEVEGLRVPRSGPTAVEQVARGLLVRHRDDMSRGVVSGGDEPASLKVARDQNTLSQWIQELEQSLGQAAL